MAKNRIIDMMIRVKKLEDAQAELAQAKVDEAAAAGETVTLADATSPTVVNRIFREIPNGALNNVNQVFILSKIPLYKTEEVFLNGCLLRKGTNADYLIDYDTKTILMNYPPEDDDVLDVNYDFDLNGQA